MKKYYCITIITILVISILHGYNIYLEYKDYTAKKIESISSTFKVSVDEERAKRAYKKHKNHKDGKQRAYYKIMSDAELRKAHPAPKDILTLDEINISDLRAKGIAETEDEAFGLLAQDLLAKKGRPFNLVQLSRIFKKNIKEEFSYTLFILDKKKKIIKSYGLTHGIENWKTSKPIAIGLSPVRFVQVKIDIPPSTFIQNSIVTLGLTSLLALLVILCVGYQMTVIRRKESILRNREVSIHGTIHDLKAPLASVLLSLSFIQDKIDNSELQQLIVNSEKQIKNLSNTIKTILMAAEAEEDKLMLNKENIDIMRIAAQAKEQILTNYEDKKPEIYIHDDRNTPTSIHADSFLIGNAIYNLMENAVKYSVKEVHIDVSITDSQQFILVSIKDHGIGIEKKYQKKIFEQFYRIPNTQHKNGYGIGLAMVKYAIKAHGGTIKVESQLSKGSTFTFTLPKK